MGKVYHRLIATILIISTLFLSIGYASVFDSIVITGDATYLAPEYDIYISNITPGSSGGTHVTGYFSTIMSAEVSSSNTSTFKITVVNQSEKVYVYERMIEGEELGIEGVYTGTSISPTVSGITFLQEIGPGEELTFTLTLTNSMSDVTDNYYLKFNFIEKTSSNIPNGLFITSAFTSSTSKIDHTDVSFIEYSTTLDSIIDRERNKTGTATYTVTVYNNTNLTYSYRDFYYQTDLEGFNGNKYIATSDSRSKIGIVTSFDTASAEEKKVLPGETKEFTVRYTVGTGVNENTDWKTRINFRFGINVDGEREALEVVEAKFLDILNTTTTYNQLIDALDNKFDGRQEWTSNYIGNVVGSSSEDSVAVNTLFAGQLQISVGKDQMDATVLIKHENLDWNNLTGDDYTAYNESNGGVFNGYGCEMTLYLTIDPLSTAGKYVPVYAVVFTCDRDANGNRTGDWYRLGSTYAGTANVVTYDGGNGTGSFVTDNWVADATTYEIIAGYSFNIDGVRYNLTKYSQNVTKGTQIENIITATDAKAIDSLKTLANHAYKIINNPRYAGMGIEIAQEVYTQYSHLYTVDANGNHTVDSDYTIAQLTPALTDLYRVMNDVLTRIDALESQQ